MNITKGNHLPLENSIIEKIINLNNHHKKHDYNLS